MKEKCLNKAAAAVDAVDAVTAAFNWRGRTVAARNSGFFYQLNWRGLRSGHSSRVDLRFSVSHRFDHRAPSLIHILHVRTHTHTHTGVTCKIALNISTWIASFSLPVHPFTGTLCMQARPSALCLAQGHFSRKWKGWGTKHQLFKIGHCSALAMTMTKCRDE